MARDDFPELPDFPDGYIPFYLRVNVGEWWNFENTSNFWCCTEGGITMEMWFYLDMYYMMWIMMQFEQYGSCPIDAETSFYIWEDCEEYEKTAFQFLLTSIVTDDGTGQSVMTGGQYKEMVLKIEANSELGEPYIWMQSANGMCLTTNSDSESEIRFFSTDSALEVGAGGNGYYFGFGVSYPTTDVMDSIVDSSPMSEPTAYDRNLYLKPSDHGYVKFGEWTAIGQTDPSVTGYITIVDANGIKRKLATIDDANAVPQTHYQAV